MFKIYELREIIKLIDQSNIQEFELEHEGSKISLKKQSTGQQKPIIVPQPSYDNVETINNSEKAVAKEVHIEKTEIEENNLHQIKSPMVGTFYKAPSPDVEQYVKVGDRVEENTVVCIVEAMKLFNEIEAEVKGVIVKILVEDGQLVEYGQPLFLVRED